MSCQNPLRRAMFVPLPPYEAPPPVGGWLRVGLLWDGMGSGGKTLLLMYHYLTRFNAIFVILKEDIEEYTILLGQTKLSGGSIDVQ